MLDLLELTSSNLTSPCVKDLVKEAVIDVELVVITDEEEGLALVENIAILALTLDALCSSCFIKGLFFSRLLAALSRLPVELAEDLRLKISEFWKVLLVGSR